MFIDQSATDLFSLAWVSTFVSLFQALGWMLFVCGLVMAVFDTAMAYESGAANIRQTCVNVIKGFMAAALFAVVPQRLYELCIALQGSFSYDLLGVFLSDTYSTIADSGLSVLYVLASDVSLFSLFYHTFRLLHGKGRVCEHQARRHNAVSDSSGKYIYDRHSQRLYRRLFKLVQTSDSDLSYSLLQTVILYLGLLTYTQHPLIAVGICLSATEVPRIAQMYGLDTSVRVNMMSVSHTVSMGAKAIGMLKGGAK